MTIAGAGVGTVSQSVLSTLNIFNVKNYGAKGDGSTDDTTSIKTAISDGISKGGGVIYFPAGNYIFTSTIQLPVALNSGQIIFKGAGMRITYLFPKGPSTNFTPAPLFPACLVFGTTTPDAAGVFTNVTQYEGMEDMSVNGSLITTGNVVGVQFTEMQYGWLKNVIIEAFPNAPIELYLRGATVTGGLGTGTTAPHTRLCSFTNTVIATAGSGNAGGFAAILQNADENDFINSSFSCTSGQAVAANSIKTVLIQMGRNNRFFGVLYSGDTTALKSGYTGLVFGPPVNEAGVANGSVLQNQDYGAVAEGFSKCFWVQADSSGNTLGNSVVNANPSIYTTDWQDDVQPTNPGGFVLGGQGGNCFYAPMLGRMILACREPAAPTAVFVDLSTTPSISGSNVWTASNSAGTIITNFLNDTDGQRILIRFTNGNTTIRDVNNGGGGNIRNYGRQDIVGAVNWCVQYQKIAGVWHQISPVRFEGGQGAIYGAALATNAVRGFFYLPSSAGPPTGVPTDIPTGSVPFQIDTSTGTGRIYVYIGGTWRFVAVA